jgi:hypothetical protein
MDAAEFDAALLAQGLPHPPGGTGQRGQPLIPHPRGGRFQPLLGRAGGLSFRGLRGDRAGESEPGSQARRERRPGLVEPVQLLTGALLDEIQFRGQMLVHDT